MNLRLARYAAIVSMLCLASTSRTQAQQGFALDRFALAPSPEDGLALQLPSTLGHGRLAARLSLGYQNEPFVSGSASGDVVVLRHHLSTQLALALGLGERFEVSLSVPMTIYQTGQEPRGSGLSFDAPNSAGFGDLALGGSAHLLGDREHGFSLGLSAALLLPIGSPDALASDGEVGARGTLSAALVLDAVTIALEGGAAYRPKRRIGFIDSGSELLMRAGAYVPVGKRFRVLAEVNAATRLEGKLMFEEVATPVEAMLGGEFALASGLRFGIAGGPGLTIATGTPAFRVLGTVGYAGPREALHPEPLDDRDRDGIEDYADRCPEQPEDTNRFEDTDGCPDAARDSDADGVPDASDKCPTRAEDRDGVDDADGCVDPDPVLDGDADGVVDGADRCPTEPETKNGVEDEDGCPDVAVVTAPPVPTPAAPAPVPEPAEVSLPEPMGFGLKSAAIKPSTNTKLVALLETLRKNPELRIAVEGHSSGDGNADFNQQLSEQRADNVKAWLVKRGIAEGRIEARGLGSSQPIGSGDDEASRSASRRVEIRKAN